MSERGVAFKPSAAARISRAVLKIERMPNEGERQGQPRHRPGADEFPWELVLFGFDIGLSKVTILPGVLHHGTKNPVWSAQTDVPLTTTGQLYVYAEYDGFASPSPTLTIPAATAVEPQSDATKFRIWLYQFDVTVTTPYSRIELYRIGHFGSIELPSTFQYGA